MLNQEIEQLIKKLSWAYIKELSKEVNKEPHNMLIDSRFDNVNDWKKVLNNSSKPSIKRNINKEDKKINKNKEKTIIPT